MVDNIHDEKQKEATTGNYALDLDVAPGHWEDMPYFLQEKVKPYAAILVKIKDKAALKAFGELLGVGFTVLTQSSWYPPIKPGEMSDKRWVDEDAKDQ